MKKNLKTAGWTFLLIIFVSAFSMSAVHAQRGPGMGRGNVNPEERAKRQTERMKEHLNLTAAQEPKVSAINLKYARKMDEIFKAKDTTAQRKNLESMNRQKETELKAVLTPDQMKIYQKMVSEMRMRGRPGPR